MSATSTIQTTAERPSSTDSPREPRTARFSLATNFDDALPPLVRPFGVFELYGKFPADFVGGGRASFMLAPLSRRRFERHVRACRASGIRFNYLLNATCLENLEYTLGGQRRIRRLLDWLDSISVTSVTVATPFLLRLIKTSYPHFDVRVSVFAAINDVRRVRFWEDLGADCVALDSIQINREFETLRAIREAVHCRLELLASNSCIQSCPLQAYHPNFLSHASQARHARRFAVDWCLLWCSYRKLVEPVNYIRADWIRPEDLVHYEQIGYDEFKLTERGAPTELLVLRARAYAERRFDGNLLELVQPYGFTTGTSSSVRRGLRWVLTRFIRPGGVRLHKLPLLYELAKKRGLLDNVGTPVYIDNRDLDGFLQRFLREGCRDTDCSSCGYCDAWAERVVKIDEDWRRDCLTRYAKVFQEIESGSLW